MSYSQKLSGQGINGDVSIVSDYTNRQHKAYKILIFGDEAERIRALTSIIAIPSVLVVINIGEEMAGKTTLNLKEINSAIKDMQTLKSALLPSRKKTIS